MKKALISVSLKFPVAYQDKNLLLKFQPQSFSLINPVTEETVFEGALNQPVQAKTAQGDWKVAIFTQDNLDWQLSGTKLSLPTAIDSIPCQLFSDRKRRTEWSSAASLSGSR